MRPLCIQQLLTYQISANIGTVSNLTEWRQRSQQSQTKPISGRCKLQFMWALYSSIVLIKRLAKHVTFINRPETPCSPRRTASKQNNPISLISRWRKPRTSGFRKTTSTRVLFTATKAIKFCRFVTKTRKCRWNRMKLSPSIVGQLKSITTYRPKAVTSGASLRSMTSCKILISTRTYSLLKRSREGLGQERKR